MLVTCGSLCMLVTCSRQYTMLQQPVGSSRPPVLVHKLQQPSTAGLHRAMCMSNGVVDRVQHRMRLAVLSLVSQSARRSVSRTGQRAIGCMYATTTSYGHHALCCGHSGLPRRCCNSWINLVLCLLTASWAWRERLHLRLHLQHRIISKRLTCETTVWTAG
jgi:hypothetical protein